MARKKKSVIDPTMVVTINKDQSIVLKEDNEEYDYTQDLKNSQSSKKVLSGALSSIEKIDLGEKGNVSVGIVNYHDNRVLIPLPEMNIQVKEDGDSNIRKNKIMNNMIGCEIDFIVAQYDAESGSTVGSRRLAMEKKMQDFYIEQTNGAPLIDVGTVAEARIIAVAESVLRVEVFGVECFVTARDMRPAWTANARDIWNVGDPVLVRVKDIKIEDNKVVEISVEGKSLCEEDTAECKKGGKYLGEVTGINEGQYFIRLKDGVNAIAYSSECGNTFPRKKDLVAFVCTRMDKTHHVAAGIITRLVKRAS